MVQDRFSAEGVAGLKNKPKSGRNPDIPKEILHEIKNELASIKQGWTTKQVRSDNNKKWNKISFYSYVYELMHKWGFKQKVLRKVCKHSIKRGKRRF
ncbi:MAG: hypothetical protein MRJ93_04815 [Nitrososphaeraceae archaeon]|nr:hypothetical protein [Nitrososphaeraceae archaeon]